MSALPRPSDLSPEEYLAAERLAETKSDYVLLEPDRIEAELHRKGAAGRWTCATFQDPEVAIHLESLGISLRLGSLYDKVEFPPEAAGR